MKRPYNIDPETEALLERIKMARRLNKVTIEQIAAALGTYRPTITNQLNGKHSLDIKVILTIARLCPNISCEWLLRGTGDIIIDNQ